MLFTGEGSHARHHQDHQRQPVRAPRSGHSARRGPHPPDLHRPRRQRRNLGRGRQALHRFCRWHRRAQHRPPPSADHGGGAAANEPLHPHLLPGAGLRKLCGTGRAPERQGPRRLRQENRIPVHRRRGGGKRRQDRALPHRPRRRDCLQRRLPRPHLADHGADRQGRALQGRFRPLPRRDFPRPLPQPQARCHRRGFHRVHRADLQE